MIPGINVVNSKTALHSHWDIHGLYRFLAYFCDQLRSKHELRTEATIHRLGTWTSTVQVDLIIAPLFNYLGSLSNLLRILTANLAHHWMLIWCEIQQPSITSFVHMQYGVLIEHFRVQKRVFAQQAHHVPEVIVRHINHWCY